MSKRVLVEVEDKVTDEEIRELMAKCIAIADRDKGFSTHFYTKSAVTLMRGTEIVMAVGRGDDFDLITKNALNNSLPAGPMVGFFLLIPVKV